MFFRSKNKIRRKTLQEKSAQWPEFKIFRIIFYFLAAVFLSVSAYVLLFSSFLEINAVYIQGTEELSYEKVKLSVDSFLGEKYLRVLARNNLLFVGKNSLETRLESDFKKINSVEIKKVFPNSLVISIKERKALLIWCSGEKCFLADEKGIAYASADFDSPEVRENHLIIIHDQSQSEVPGDCPVFNPEFGNFLIEFRQRVKDVLGLDIDSNFETPKAISGDLTGLSREGWKVNLSAEIGAEKEAEMLKVVLDKNIDSEKRKKLEYVDLRTEGKVYYKLKNAEAAE